MGQGHHLSRREILNSIRALGSGSLLLPLSALQGERQNTQAPAVIRGALRDGATGKPIAAKIRSAGYPVQASGSSRKVC
jgi:hypothetical protein